MEWNELSRLLGKIMGWPDSPPVRSIDFPQHAKDLLSWQRRLKWMLSNGRKHRKALKRNTPPHILTWSEYTIKHWPRSSYKRQSPGAF